MAKYDPELRAHRGWLGLLQPVGLVVSPPALVRAQAVPSQNVAELQQELLSVVERALGAASVTDEPALTNLPAFFQTVLGWSLDDIAGASGGPPLPDGLELVLPDFNETLRPTYAAVDSMGDGSPLMLVQAVPRDTALDETPDDDGRTGWSASPQAKLERLLREVKVPAGLLCNGDAMRLVYAPGGESSGHLTFPVAAMCEVSGRPILAALDMLLSEHRVFSAPDGRRLGDILSESRKYQAEVSNALSDQVLGALWELLRGFQASDPDEGRRNFDDTAREDPQHVYGGLIAVLMRLIFVLYAEDEGLMPEGEVYANNYSVSGLYDRLRSDAGRYPDTMDQRYGAYAWLLSLFRLIFDGGGHAALRLPTRHGQLFNPDEFPFLEGRPGGVGRVVGEKFEAPRVSDGCIYRVLHALLVLDGERLSYRALDVEQVGSVYEAMIVGNPPFQGGRNLSATQGKVYSDWLLALHADSSGGADLVAHFFRRAFSLIGRNGSFGLIATNSIGQGDTRSTGLRWICRHGGEIFSTRKRVKWPGLAAVVVSVVHVAKGLFAGARCLDGREVPAITAFLFHRGGHDNPAQLAFNASKSFQGSIVLGMGFTFDDTDTKGVATPLPEMQRLTEQDPRNQEVIVPYIGGEEVNTSPTHAHHRYVINFGERSEEECRERFPDLMTIIETKVKPERITKDARKYPRMVNEWWKFWNSRPELHAAIARLERVLVICRHQPHWGICLLPAASVFAESLIVFPLDTRAAFSVLQSRPHEIWARFFGSSLEDRLRYTPSDCFETFPFPGKWGTHPTLEAAGKTYYDFRAQLMVKHGEGLTKTYNRFHDPNETNADIQTLRELHATMDRTVLDAYGWTDIPTDCKFLLDYEIDEETWGKKKKPYRYRWPEEVHDEVLARLLDVNQRRYAEEVAAGSHAVKGTSAAAPKKRTRRRAALPSPNITPLLD